MFRPVNFLLFADSACDLGLPWARRHRRTVELNSKIPPKWDLKNSWNWHVILVPATVWQILNRKRKLCEFAETSIEKLVESPWTNLYFGGFLTFGTTVRCCIVLYVGDVPSFESVRKPKVSQSNTAKIYFINTSRLWPVISLYSLKVGMHMRAFT